MFIKSLIPVLIGLSIVGCKSSSNGNRVTTTRSKTGTQKPAQTPAASARGTANPGDTAPTSQQKLACGDYSKKMESLGWTSDVLELNDQNKKIQVSYFIPQNSDLKNPVLVLPHHLDNMTEELARNILEIAKENLFDPIIMEPRGIGCSTALPTDKKEWNSFTADKVAADAEVLRKKLLNDQPWKVWANNQSALIALKVVEMNPQTVRSLHLSDFALADTPVEQEKHKLSAQIKAWKDFKEFSKKNGFEITDDVEVKIKKVLLEQHACTDSQKICKLDLMTSFIELLSGDDSQWKKSVAMMAQLSEGKIPNELNLIAQKTQKDYLYNQLLIAAHVDSDEYLTACEKALNDSTLKPLIEVNPLNSCRADQALKNLYLSELRGKVQHKKLDTQLIQKNIKDRNIEINIALGERSLLNPLSLASDTAKMLTGAEDLENLLTPESGTDLFFEPQLLESLK